LLKTTCKLSNLVYDIHMKILTKPIEKRLRENSKNPKKEGQKPALKLFNPAGAATWLFTELDDDGDTLFGLCDLGMGEPELGYASLSELTSIRVGFGLKIERDLHFKATKTLAEYAKEAREKGRICA